MNFFFNLESSFFLSSLQIPKFKNRGNSDEDVVLFQADINFEKNKWVISKSECNEDENFYYFSPSKQKDKNSIFFLTKKNELKLDNKFIELDELFKYSDFTRTKPAFRCSLNIENINGGYSSYQSEYPFDMTIRKGSILSPINHLLSKGADKNLIIFRNIFRYPIFENFNAYLIDFKSEKILYKKTFKTNKTNFIDVDEKFLKENVFFFTNQHLGIPIYYSEKNSHISFEHTHPLTEYILSSNRYYLIKQVKEKFNAIVKKDL